MKKFKKPIRTKYGEVSGYTCDLNDIMTGTFSDSVLNNGYMKYRVLYRRIMERFKNRHHSQWRRETSVEIVEKTMRKISETFFNKMLMDLIINNYEFCFPDDTCRLSIGYRTLANKYCKKKFKYNIKTGGLTPQPRIVFDRTIYKVMKNKKYYFSLTKKYKQILMNEVIVNNHEYINSEQYDRN